MTNNFVCPHLLDHVEVNSEVTNFPEYNSIEEIQNDNKVYFVPSDIANSEIYKNKVEHNSSLLK